MRLGSWCCPAKKTCPRRLSLYSAPFASLVSILLQPARNATSFLLIRHHYLTCHLCLHVPKPKDTQRASPPRHAVPREPARLPGTVCADPTRRAAWRERPRPRLRGQMIDPWDAARSPTESGPAVLCQWSGSAHACGDRWDACVWWVRDACA